MDSSNAPGSASISAVMAPAPIAPVVVEIVEPVDDDPTDDEIQTRGSGVGAILPTDADDELNEDDDMTAAGDYPILGKPSIGLVAFGSVLRNASSPAAPEYIGIYNAAVQHGVDPAVLLAVFQHESSFGKAGAAAHTKNIGNLVYTATSAAMGAGKSGRWSSYSSWTQSAQDTSRLLAVYGHNAIRKGVTTSTVRTFPNVWAPSSDGNKPAAYGAALARSIAGWTGKGGVPISAAVARAKPAKNAKAAAKATPHTGTTIHQAIAAVPPLPAGIGSVSLTAVAGLGLIAVAVIVLVIVLAKSGGSGDEE